MTVEREMIHDIVDLIPADEIAKVYAILNAYLSHETEDVLTEHQEERMHEGFRQIIAKEYISASDYMEKRGLD